MRFSPTRDPFDASHSFSDDVAEVVLRGKLDQSTFGEFQKEIDTVLKLKPHKIVLRLEDLESMANVGIRVLLFARQKMDVTDRADIIAVGPNATVREALMRADPAQEDIVIVDTYDPKKHR